LTPIFEADSAQPIQDAALVLTAMDIAHEVDRSDQGWTLSVEANDEVEAYNQLNLYWRENAPSAEKPVQATVIDSGWPGVLGYLAVIWILPIWQSNSPLNLSELGALHAQAISQGEIWRAVTALTLHADIAHIAANSLFGAVFGLFVGRYLGSGFGWLLVLLCGIAANLLNGLIQPDAFRAIGASTATFAALGLVPAFGWRRGFFRGQGAKRGFAPIFAAIAILAFTGFGGERIDVLGHLFGFIAGIVAGLLVANVKVQTRTVADQIRAGGLAIGIVAIAWLAAI
jgi:rhomboid protease GluP